jgi:hypothetical protein
MRPLADVCQDLIVHKSDIVREFNAATACAPWDHLPEEERINFLRNLLEPLVRLTLVTPDGARLRRRTIVVAAYHGDRRRQQGFGDEILPQDFHALGQVIVSRLVQGDPETPETDAFQRIEGLLSVSCLASLRGFHRQQYEAQGRWPETLEVLDEEMPLYCW